MQPIVALQHLVPQKLLTRVVYAATRWRLGPWKNAMIRVLTRINNINLGEAASANLADYPHFNAFFTRELKAGARHFDSAPGAFLMPADGKVSELGPISGERILQAKGHDYTVAELLGGEDKAAAFRDGMFATIYLSPRDYHRVHMPFAGKLVETLHVPGKLFSVAPHTVAAVPRLFARNERLVCHFDTEFGPLAVVLVGAMLVSGVETVWNGVEIPPYASAIVRRDYRDRDILLARGAELGRFNMGSTVIVLIPAAAKATFDRRLAALAPVLVGQTLATLGAPKG